MKNYQSLTGINHSDQTWRRMIYQERMRRVDDRIFTAFDFPDCGQIRAKRPAIQFTRAQSLEMLCRTLINTNEFAFLP